MEKCLTVCIFAIVLTLKRLFMGLFDKIKSKVNKVVQSSGEALGLKKIKHGLEKTRTSIVGRIQSVVGKDC